MAQDDAEAITERASGLRTSPQPPRRAARSAETRDATIAAALKCVLGPCRAGRAGIGASPGALRRRRRFLRTASKCAAARSTPTSGFR